MAEKMKVFQLGSRAHFVIWNEVRSEAVWFGRKPSVLLDSHVDGSGNKTALRFDTSRFIIWTLMLHSESVQFWKEALTSCPVIKMTEEIKQIYHSQNNSVKFMLRG